MSNVVHLSFPPRRVTCDPSKLVVLTDEQHLKLIADDCQDFLRFGPKVEHLSRFVHGSARHINALTESHPLKAGLKAELRRAVCAVVWEGIIEIQQWEPFIEAADMGEVDEAEAVAQAARAEEWFRAAAATQRWVHQLRKAGVRENDLLLASRLRDVFLSLSTSTDRWLSEAHGDRQEWVTYAGTYLACKPIECLTELEREAT
jgi:hypothetical protein